MLARLATLKARFPLATLYFSSTAWLTAGTAAQLVTFIILARALGVEQFGQLMAITAATHLGTHLCGVGAGEGMVRRVSRDRDAYPAMLGHNIILTLGSAAILIAIITAGIAWLIPLDGDALDSLVIVAAFVVSNVLFFRWILFAEQIFIAHWKIGYANTVNVGFAMAKAATAALACLALGVDTLADWAIWWTGVHALGASLCVAAIVPFGRPKWGILRDELRLGVHFSTPWFFLTLRNNIDLLVLSAIASPAVVGAYSVVKRVVETSLVTSNSLSRLLYPKLSRAGKEGCEATLRITNHYLLPIIAVAAATSLALYIVAPFVPVLVGEDYAEAVPGIQILCWSIIIFSIKTAAFDALGAADQHGTRATVYNSGSLLAAGMIGVSAYFFLVPGAFAAIYASQIAIGIALWSTLISLSRRHRADPPLRAAEHGGSL